MKSANALVDATACARITQAEIPNDDIDRMRWLDTQVKIVLIYRVLRIVRKRILAHGGKWATKLAPTRRSSAATTPAAPQFISYPMGYGGYVIQTLWPAAEMRNLVFVLMGVATGVLVRVATRVLLRRWLLWRGGRND